MKEWIYFLSNAKQINEKVEKKGFLWMEHKRWRETLDFLSYEKNMILVGPAITKC